MQSTGNINYSLNKNDFYKVLLLCTLFFIPFYYITVIISMIYLFKIKYSQYSNTSTKYSTNSNIEHYFKSITYRSPFDIINISHTNINNYKFIGLSQISYIIILISYLITFFILLQGLIRNFIYSVYSNIIQVNHNNNPYNNPNNITKINESPNGNIFSNYTTIIGLSFVFLIPLTITYFMNFLNLDNYNIIHSKWISYVLLFLLFSPLLIVLLCYSYFNQRLSIFSNLYKYLEQSDFSFVQFITDNFNFKIYTILPFLFIVFIFIFYQFIYTDINFYNSNLKKAIAYFIIFLIIFIVVPFILILFSFNLLFDNKNFESNNNNNDIIQNIKDYGISSLYDLLVKYNYPCFPK